MIKSKRTTYRFNFNITAGRVDQ